MSCAQTEKPRLDLAHLFTRIGLNHTKNSKDIIIIKTEQNSINHQNLIRQHKTDRHPENNIHSTCLLSLFADGIMNIRSLLHVGLTFSRNLIVPEIFRKFSEIFGNIQPNLEFITSIICIRIR